MKVTNKTSDSVVLLSSNIPRKMVGEEGGEQGKRSDI